MNEVIPTIVAWKIKNIGHTRQVIVICPFCGSKHFHGWPHDQKDIGHRGSDCIFNIDKRTGKTIPFPPNSGYYIVPWAGYIPSK